MDVNMATYKLRCSLLGHSMDVRAVSASPFLDGVIITGSRDRTARVWIPNEHDCGYSELLSTTNHSNFIACICVIPPTPEYSNGVILTGSNDCTICAFTLDSPTCLYKLIGHSNTVCALAAGKFGTVISGSWDQTAKVWLGQKCLMTLQGHSQAVWAVAILPEHGLMLTGSADHHIRMWKAGNCERIFTGHTDCVRGLAVLNAEEFLSCSNDASIRRWSIAGHCIQTYYGHSNFVYSVAVLSGGNFVSTGEDRTVRVWVNGKCHQTIQFPAQSIWCIAAVNNDDFVVGSSDGIARIFSKDASRQASIDQLKAFDEEVSKSCLNTGEIGDLKIDELPGNEALYEPGKRDGQTKMIRDGGTVTAYRWISSESRWQKIGDVVGASGSTQATSGKVLHEGKEYDYVFKVDVEDGKPALKLPYNVSEDPWFAAQRFIHKNNLPQTYLDQVANFILDNTKGMTLGQSGLSSFSDPFTGGARYIPDESDGSQQISTADPFTGSGRYVPEATQNTHGIEDGFSIPIGDSQDQHGSFSKFFPQIDHLTFDIANPSAILNKLREFNTKTGDGEHKVDDMVLEEVCKLTDASAQCSSLQISTLEKLLQWPHDILFPVLDVLRLAMKLEKINTHFSCELNAPQFIGFLLEHLTSNALPANQLMVIRTLCNMMCLPMGEQLVLSNWDPIMAHVFRILPTKNKNIDIGVSTLLLNYIVTLNKNPSANNKLQCLSSLASMFEKVSDREAIFRLLVCLGTLVHKDEVAISYAKNLNLLLHVQQIKSIQDPAKIAQCASDLERLL